VHKGVRDTKSTTCRQCSFAEVAYWPPRTILICQTSPHLPGEWCVVAASDTCKNFAPLKKADPKRKNEDGSVRLIPLTQGKFAIVDEEDYPELSRHTWHLNSCNKGPVQYAARTSKGKAILMHRFLTNAPKDLCVDHIDHNGLNNTKRNLRLCTHAQNQKNIRSKRGSTSKYKGVSFRKKINRFIAEVSLKGKRYYLGCYKDEVDAAKVYDKKAKELFGEFAYLNFPDEA
jgi:hypothetical protein